MNGAAFNGDKTRILIWSENDIATLQDVFRLPHRHLIDVARGTLPDDGTSEVENRYGIMIAERIRDRDTRWPDRAQGMSAGLLGVARSLRQSSGSAPLDNVSMRDDPSVCPTRKSCWRFWGAEVLNKGA